MKNCFLVLFSAFFMILISNLVFAEPKWYGNTTTPLSPAVYYHNQVYQFQINWTDNETGIDGIKNVIFESNFNSTSLNYTQDNITMWNNSETWFVNLTDRPVGSFLYKWYAINGSDNWNSSEQWTYTINKGYANVSLFLDGKGNKTYYTYDNANLTTTVNVTGLTIWLNATLTNFTAQNNTTIIENITHLTDSEGLYNITAWTEGNENYTGNSVTHWLTIDNTNPPSYDNISVPQNNTEYSTNKTYEIAIDWEGIVDDVRLNFNETNYYYKAGQVEKDGQTYSVNLYNLSAGNYNFTWYANDTRNNLNSTENTILTLVVNKNSNPPITITVSPSTYVVAGTQTTVTCSATNTNEVSPNKLYRDGTELPGFSETTVLPYRINSYNYTCTYTLASNSNYTGIGWLYQLLTITVSPTTTGTGTSGGGGAAQTPTYAFSVSKYPGTVTVNAGESKEVSFTFMNTWPSPLNILDISITVSGISSSWYNLDKTTIDKIAYSGGIAEVKLTFKIPSDAEVKDYKVKISATGKFSSGTQKTAEKEITLSVKAVTAAPPGNQTQNITETITQNITQNQTAEGPTGLIIFYGQELVVLVIGIGIIAGILYLKFFRKKEIYKYKPAYKFTPKS